MRGTCRACAIAVLTLGSVALFGACDGAGLQLSPISSVQTPDLGFTGGQPQPGNLFIVVDLKLTNASGDSFPLTALAFSITDKDGVEYLGGAFTDLLDGACKTGTSLGPDGSTECKVVFEAPEAIVTQKISYKNPSESDPVIYEAVLKTTPCGTVCGAQCCGAGTCNSNGSCVCSDDDASCSVHGDCCSGFCKSNAKCGCYPKGTACPFVDGDCCGGGCSGGVCI